MRIAFLILIIALVAGCGKAPDLSNKETMAEILDQAIELEKIQYRGKRGEELRYAQNEPAPYTGWVKVMHENGQVHKLFHYRDGKMDGVQAEWNRDGQKFYEVHFKDNIQDGRVTAWWGNGQKMIEGKFQGGKLMSAESWTLEGSAMGKHLVDGNGKISIRSEEAGQGWFIKVENGVANTDSSYPVVFLEKIFRTSGRLESEWLALPVQPARILERQLVQPPPLILVQPPPLIKIPRQKVKSPNGNPQPGMMPVRTDLELQLALDRLGFSPGSIDGICGSQAYAALRAFQSSVGLVGTGRLDANTRQRLLIRGAPWTTYTVTTNDVRSLRSMGRTWQEKSDQDFLAYESLLELIAERHHCSPRLLMRENPSVNWEQLKSGSKVKVPNITAPPIKGRAAVVRIGLSDRTLQAFDEDGRVILHFPCSIAARVDKRPLGELKVDVVTPNPTYTFDPAKFPNTPEARAGGGKLILNPGPNNPVGTVWLSLNRPGYGIHGTPDPEKIGRTTSLGCFRLANWNAERLQKVVQVGTKVIVDTSTAKAKPLPPAPRVKQPTRRPQPRSNPIKVDTNAADKLRNSLSGKTKVNFKANSSTYNRYKDVVAAVYEVKWNRALPPKSPNYRGKIVRVRVTVSRSGRVVSARIVGPSGMVPLDESVQDTLNSVRSFGQSFPPGVQEREQTFTINFQDKR